VRRAAALLLCPLLLAGALTACGGSGDDEGSNDLPSVTGSYGEKPTINLPKDPATGKKLQVEVLDQGDGPKVKKGDLLVADYIGQIFSTGKVFDNSYDRGQPVGFEIGNGSVIPGWDKSLVGVAAGSRVEMVIPPAEGYGKEGNSQAGIKGTDSLVFVVDLIASYGKGAPTPDNSPVADLPTDLPNVTGATNQRPTISVPEGTTPPKEPEVTVLAKGNGPKVDTNRLAVVHFDAVDWAGKPLSNTWDHGVPRGVPIGVEGQPSPFDLLTGVPAGSRVLLELPATNEGKPDQDSVAVVVDVLASHGPAKESS
jgi:peptidylprolyl isomerase